VLERRTQTRVECYPWRRVRRHAGCDMELSAPRDCRGSFRAREKQALVCQAQAKLQPAHRAGEVITPKVVEVVPEGTERPAVRDSQC
jgi:hypothetical protein